MTALQEWQHHVRQTHAQRTSLAWCGVPLCSFDWAFVNIDHAVHTVQQLSRLQPCPDCARAIVAELSKVLL